MEVFRGIRYARAVRFGEPVLEPLGEDIAKACDNTPAACPQVVTGPSEIEMPKEDGIIYTEDCLRLNVYTPSTEGTFPVMVWLHGGAFVTGGAEMSAYDASQLCSEGGIVVVSVSYRLGAFGYLDFGRKESANLGLKDQICALEWVRDNIGRFGGDPGKVTLAGQSAGAMSVAHILAKVKESLARKAIVMSGPLSMTMSPKKMRKNSSLLLSILGKDIEGADIWDIVKAQSELSRKSIGMAFMPEGSMFPTDGTIMPGVEEVLVTAQKDDAMKFSPARFLSPLLSRVLFINPSRKYSKVLSSLGVNSQFILFDWRHKEGPLGATHTIELPLLFGSWDTWHSLEMLQGVTREEFENKAHEMKRLICDFVKR